MLDPKHFWEVHYLGNLNEWDKQPDDIRLAMNVVVSANQLADWIFKYRDSQGNRVAGDVAQYRNTLVLRTPEFGIVHDVADCHKHFELTRPSAVVVAARDVRNVGSFTREFSDEFDVSRIEITDAKNGIWNLEDVLKVVTAMWKTELTKLNLL